MNETLFQRSMTLPDELLEGAIDIHVHAGPHLGSSPRRVDPFEAARQAREVGMRALVFMDVFKESAGTAWLVQRQVPGIEVFGGIILSTNHGGINPRAVKTALNYGAGAKFVSFGAHSTHFKVSTEGRFVDGKPVLFQDLYPEYAAQELDRSIRIPLEDPVPEELSAVLELIAAHPHVYLNTGHVSGNEALRLVELAARYGIERVLIAGLAVEELSLEQQRAAAAKGTYLERSLGQYIGTEGIPKTHYYVEPEYMDELIYDPAVRKGKHGGLLGLKEQIRAVGPEHIVLSTDYGVRSLPPPVEGMRQLLTCLLDMELSNEEIRLMTAHNPARLLGLR
ncbi:MAG: DUF6282 family protein [Truepera sp.]|nr:DUF6282 family protein [Truepera sp.]